MSGKRAALVEAYIGALESRAVLILTGPTGQPAKISFEPDKKLDLFDALWFAKPAHAELVAMRCRSELREIGAERAGGWFDMPAREVRDHIVIASAFLGASFRSAAEIEAAAQSAVDEILATVEAQRRAGGLAQVNAQYKIYRQQQMAKGEKAMPYSAHLAAFTRSLVVLAAKNANVH